MAMKKTEMLVNGLIPYKASLTRQQFLFYEMRTTAKLYAEGLDDEQIIERITAENLFQYPTEKSLRLVTQDCIARLKAVDDDTLVEAIATQPSEVSKQICLYAMMKHSRIVWEFMVKVIGEKYSLRDSSFGKIDLNVFFMRLQEQDDTVAAWSESTISKLKQVLTKILVENGYLDNAKSETLNPVLISSVLENAIRCNNDDAVLPAFNCFM